MEALAAEEGPRRRTEGWEERLYLCLSVLGSALCWKEYVRITNRSYFSGLNVSYNS